MREKMLAEYHINIMKKQLPEVLVRSRFKGRLFPSHGRGYIAVVLRGDRGLELRQLMNDNKSTFPIAGLLSRSPL